MKTHPKHSPLEIILYCFIRTQQEYFNMSKICVISGVENETVFSETYHSGYVTSDDEIELSNYLLQFPSRNDFIVNIDMENNEYYTSDL